MPSDGTPMETARPVILIVDQTSDLNLRTKLPASAPAFEFVSEFQGLGQRYVTWSPNVVIYGVGLKLLHFRREIHFWRGLFPKSRLLIMTANPNPNLARRAQRAGAHGAISFEEFSVHGNACLAALVNRESWWRHLRKSRVRTPIPMQLARELLTRDHYFEIWRRADAGFDLKRIAHELGLTTRTAQTYLYRSRKILGRHF